MNIFSVIDNDNFLCINRDAISKLGLHCATMLGELAGERYSHEQAGDLVNGMFCATIKDIQTRTALSRHQQDVAISKLEELGIVELVIKGLPAKRYFKLNEDKLFEILAN
ncbi:hypothetical protein [Lactobacillus phage c5]|uniref:Uncharacterized protein n=1 Tax=Lactobacillus phage c5 TaxID=2892341 RepID=F8J193_9CAUD|nr:hypothetical protein F368_gp37 [Lactobacillus phage c5]ACA63331.1 hypothetical protein [Lactobacillus phage c5]